MKSQLFGHSFPLTTCVRFTGAALLAAMLTASTCLGASIGVQFTDGTYSLSPTDSAGAPGFVQNHFNTTGDSGSLLWDNTGAATTAAFSVSSNIGILHPGGTPPSGADEILNANVIAAAPSGFTLNITDIPYDSYTLVIYELAVNAAKQGITLGSTTYYSQAPANPRNAGFVDRNPATPYNYIFASSTDINAPTPNGNYMVFTNLSGSSQSVFIQSLTPNAASEINGFQIIQAVPEPTAAGVAFGVLGVLAISIQRPRRHGAGLASS